MPESYVQSKVIDPAIKGVRNVLGSCLKSKSVKRVVFTSSISTLTAKDENERWRSVVDETCKTPIDHVLKTKASGWVNTHTKTIVLFITFIVGIINRFRVCVCDRFMYYPSSYQRKRHLDMQKREEWILFQSLQLLSRVHSLLLLYHQAFKFSCLQLLVCVYNHFHLYM